jgi:hypothetical protein
MTAGRLQQSLGFGRQAVDVGMAPCREGRAVQRAAWEALAERMLIAPGHQFGAITFAGFSLGEAIAAELDFGFGLSATAGPPAPLNGTWRNLPGTFAVENIEDANLSLLATAVSPTPLVIDDQLLHMGLTPHSFALAILLMELASLPNWR